MISHSIRKSDDDAKISGQAKYIDDLVFPNMLYAKTLRSSKSHAKILKINIPILPEGYTIVDKNDVPGKNSVKIIVDDQPFFADKQVNYKGEPILLVVGPDRTILDEIINNIKVKYKDLTPTKKSFVKYSFSHGNPDKLFKQATKIFEWTYEMGYQEHAYIETNGVIGTYDDGIISVFGSMQCPYYVKNAVIDALGVSPEKINIIQSTTGGAFGGKEDYPSLIAGHVAIATLKVKQPVKLIFNREEDIFATTKRHPAKITLKTVLDNNNKLLALNANIVIDGGAYSTLSSVVLQRAMFAISGVYKFSAIKVNGEAICSNNVPSGAFRGFGCPQAIFAIETQMYNIAKELNIDPVEFKIINMVKTGDSTCTGGNHRCEVKIDKIAKRIIEMSGYNNPLPPNQSIGISFFLHGNGFTGNGEQDHIKAEVALIKELDQTVDILVSSTDMGQGIQTTLRKIVSKVIGIPIEQTKYQNPDTSRVPDSGPTVASRTIMIVGKLIEEAAIELLSRWNESETLKITKHYTKSNFVEWDQNKFHGDAYPSYSWGANAALVNTDPITFENTIKKVWSVYDIGVAIDDRIVEGQIQGGILQGVGYSHLEFMENINGNFMQKNLTDYVIPTVMDSCSVQNELIENPFEGGPFGAKGLGEITLVGAPAAVVSAIANSTGLVLNKIPVTPEFLMEVKNSVR